MDILVKNYRSFDESAPLKLTLDRGILAITGANNSGKSTVLRFFYEFRPLWRELRDNWLKRSFDNNRSQFFLVVVGELLDKARLFHNKNDRDLSIEVSIKNCGLIEDQSVERYIERLKLTGSRVSPHSVKFELFDNYGALVEGQGTIVADWAKIKNKNGDETSLSLTGINKALQLLENCMYLSSNRFIHSQDFGGRDNDLVLGPEFVKLWNTSKLGTVVENSRATIKVTKDIQAIFGIKALEINGAQNNRDLNLTMDGESLLLSEMGNGIAQLILVLAQAALKKPSFILIDEPENGLHASLQIAFLTTLASYSNFGCIFTTHSIGLARTVADRIFTARMKSFHTELRDFGDSDNESLIEQLGELSYSSYRDLGWEKILLVEGVTDVKVFQQFLRLYRLEGKIVVMPGTGDALFKDRVQSELQELMRIANNNLYVIIDSERTTLGREPIEKRKAFKDQCDKIGVPCLLTDRRSTENYFPDRAIKRALGNDYAALGDFGQPRWNKKLNWTIALEMEIEDLKGTDIDQFIKEHFV